MRTLFACGLAASSLLLAAAPASAVTFTSAGQYAILTFGGQVASTGVPNLTSTLKLTFNGFDMGGNATLAYEMDNTSSAPIDSRVSAFGFDVLGAYVHVGNSSATGEYDSAASGNVPEGFGFVELCFTAGSNCAGGGNGGIFSADPVATGNLVIAFSGGSPASLMLDRLFVRYQSISGTPLGTSGIGSQPITSFVDPGLVPEPATWTMLIAGFGLVGVALRRKPRGIARTSS